MVMPTYAKFCGEGPTRKGRSLAKEFVIACPVKQSERDKQQRPVARSISPVHTGNTKETAPWTLLLRPMPLSCPTHPEGTGRPGVCSLTRTLKNLPGPDGLPILGNILQLDLQRLHSILEQWAGTYGSLYKFRIARKNVVAVSDVNLINEVLRKRPAAYRRLESIAPVLNEMGINGVFSAEGDQWLRQRRTAMQALNTAHLKSFFPTLMKVTGAVEEAVGSGDD